MNGGAAPRRPFAPPDSDLADALSPSLSRSLRAEGDQAILKTMGTDEAERLFDALRAEYVAKVPETLAGLERQVVEWPAGENVSKELLRDIHSLKGTAGTYGLGFATSVCHNLEDFLSEGKDGTASEHDAYLDHVLGFLDIIRDYVAHVIAGGDASGGEFEAKLDALLHPGENRKQRVLIVEPGKSMSRLLGKLLDSHGLSFSTSRSGYEALGRLTREKYDGILTSYETSDISGISLAKAARAIEEIADGLKIILVTANDLGDEPPAVDGVVLKNRDLATSLAEILRRQGLIS